MGYQLVLGGKLSLAHLFGVLAGRGDDLLGQLGILLHERRHKLVVEAECIVAHQHLTVTVRTGADSDRRNAQLSRDFPRHAFRD